jgi:threonine 3-dehydrogenase
MTILITGGSGWLASFLIKDLLKEGYTDIVIMDIVPPNKVLLREVIDKVKYVRGDVRVWSDLVSIIRKYNITDVFHLAALLTAQSEEMPHEAFSINAVGTFNVLEAARLFNVRKVIFPSSIAVYGPGVREPVDENQPERPTNFYGITKLFGECLGYYYFRKYGLDFRGVRYPRLVGPFRGGGGTAVYPSRMIEEVILRKYYECEVNREYTIPIMYVKDASRFLIKLYQAENVKTRIYNVQGLVVKAEDIAEALLRHITGATIKFPEKEVKLFLEIPLYYDDSRAKEELGWNLYYDSIDKIIEDFMIELSHLKT